MTHSRPRRTSVRLALGLVALTAAGCTPTVSTHGYRMDEQALAEIRPGLSTRDEVMQKLGSPSTRTTFDDSTWYYVSQVSEKLTFYQTEVVDQEVVAISFDDSGVVDRITRRNLEDGVDVAFVERETPTTGNELSAWEQIVGNIGRFNPEGDTGF
jgi:outer membrane protein assembly factor BamE (lipoprotein component of BamABCDE complex)